MDEAGLERAKEDFSKLDLSDLPVEKDIYFQIDRTPTRFRSRQRFFRLDQKGERDYLSCHFERTRGLLEKSIFLNGFRVGYR